MIIDIHTHTLCPGVNELLGGPPSPELIPYQRDMAPEGKAVDAAQGPELMRKFNDLDTRLGAMDAMGIDFQIVAPAPGQQHYWAEAELLAAVSARQNDHVAALVAQSPGRMAGLGTLPLSAPQPRWPRRPARLKNSACAVSRSTAARMRWNCQTRRSTRSGAGSRSLARPS